MYENKEYLSEVNDFGDEYHQYDDDVQIVDAQMLKEIKTIKRRYRDFDEWYDAITLFNDYMQLIVDKYGGKKKFKFFYKLNMVKEYIPVYPVLRRIKVNMPYIKKNIPRPKGRVEYHCQKTQIKQLEPYECNVSFSLKENKKLAEQFDNKTRELDRRRISEDIARIQNYYAKKISKPVKMSKKMMKRKMKKEQFTADEYIPIKDALKKYYEKKSLGYTLEEADSEEAIMYYKGTVVKVSEYDEVVTYDSLKELGLRLDRNVLGKRARKVVLKRKKKEKKLKKVGKKKKKLTDKYIKEFTNGDYDTFDEFQRSMRTLIGKQIRGEA